MMACWVAACTLGRLRCLCESVILLKIMQSTPGVSGALTLHAYTSFIQKAGTPLTHGQQQHPGLCRLPAALGARPPGQGASTDTAGQPKTSPWD